MPRVRDWPLTGSESALVAEVMEFAADSLARVALRFPDRADEILAEFGWQVCINIHRWPRRLPLAYWTLVRIGKSVSAVLRRKSRHPTVSIDSPPARRALARHDARGVESLIADATRGLTRYDASVVRLAADGRSHREIARSIGSGKTEVHRILARAEPAVTAALSP